MQLFVFGIAIHLLRAVVTRPQIGDSLSGQEALSVEITFSADMSGQIYFVENDLNRTSPHQEDVN